MRSKRRAAAAGVDVLPHVSGRPTSRRICPTAGRLEHAQRIAGHASPKTTKLYDRTADTISLDEMVVVGIQPGGGGIFDDHTWGNLSDR